MVGELALDIETASPFAEPSDGANDTEYFELLAVAVGDVDVLFALHDRLESTA